MSQPLKVLFVATEAIPFTHPGGLSDVVGSLPAALRRRGVDARVILPFHRCIQAATASRVVARDLDAPLGPDSLRFDVREAVRGPSEDAVPVWFVEREDLFDRPSLYGDRHGDYYDNLERFTFFCQAVLRAVEALEFRPHLLHCHDWQSALVPALLKGPFRRVARLQDIPTVFTFHDVRYQGVFPKEKLPLTGLSEWEFFHSDGLEYWGKLSFLKAGLVYADALTTTSPAYAREIQQSGLGMEGILHKRREVLSGILNGVDYGESDPATDTAIAHGFSSSDLAGRAACKRDLLSHLGLDPNLADRPLLGLATPLQRAKGLDLLLDSLDTLASLDVTLAVFGTGEPAYQARLVQASRQHPGRLAVRFSLEDRDLRRLLAGVDLFLLPSRQKPCGATQMHALRYGAVPVAMATGGLEDVVRQWQPGEGNGFKFHNWDAQDLVGAVRQALDLWKRDPEEWRALQVRGMEARFTWDHTAAAYHDLYRSLCP